MEAPLSEEELNKIYNWVDEIPMSRPKKNIARDFADGVLMAEIIAHFVPKIVEVHNYVAANSTNQKLYNWNTLNQKVFKKLGFQLNKKDIESVINCQPEVIERILKIVQIRIDKYFEKVKQGDNYSSPDVATGKNVSNKNQQNNTLKQSNLNEAPAIDPNVSKGKDQVIQELKETIEILELKVKKLEQLVKLKDSKIQTLQNKLIQHGDKDKDNTRVDRENVLEISFFKENSESQKKNKQNMCLESKRHIQKGINL